MRKSIISKIELLDLAGEIVKNEGLESCTIRRLAKEAGIATGTMYNYYSSRDALFLDLFESSWKKTINRLNKIETVKFTAKENLTNFILILKEDIESRQGLGHVIFSLGGNHDYLFDEIRLIISGILKKSEIYIDVDKSTISLNSKWLFIIIANSIINKDEDTEAIIPELLQRFL